VEKGLPEIYRMADIFLTTSQIETQGLVLLEAAASGLPIIAVNATCIPEIVQDGVNGFLANPGDIDTFSTSIRMLLNHSELMHVMRREGLTLAATHDFSNSHSLHESVYLDVVRQSNKRRRLEIRRLFLYWKLRKSLLGIK
jgi:glycosyltransferase involved in cell wall biosynthesis